MLDHRPHHAALRVAIKLVRLGIDQVHLFEQGLAGRRAATDLRAGTGTAFRHHAGEHLVEVGAGAGPGHQGRTQSAEVDRFRLIHANASRRAEHVLEVFHEAAGRTMRGQDSWE